MKSKCLSVGLLIIVVLIIVCINSACGNSDNNQPNTEETSKTQPASSGLSAIPSSDQDNVSNDTLEPVFEGDIQNIVLSLLNHQNVYEVPIDGIRNVFVNEDSHLYIVLSDNSMIDAGLVDDTGIRSFESEKQYTVSFYDYDGTLICSRKVNDGDMAIAPNNRVRDGYTFIGWDLSFASVHSDLEVTAQYEPLPSTPQITVNDTVAFSDKNNIEVELVLNNNPGILGMTLQLDYESRYFSLIRAENGSALNSLSFTKPGRFESPCRFTWDGIELAESDICDGIILTLTFEISDDIQQGVYPNSLNYEEDGIIDRELSPTDVDIEQGSIIIIE